MDELALDAWTKCAVEGCRREVPWKYRVCPLHNPVRDQTYPWRLTAATGETYYPPTVTVFSNGEADDGNEAA